MLILVVFGFQLISLSQEHASLGEFTSDSLKILSVVGAYEYHGGAGAFCSDHFVRLKVCCLYKPKLLHLIILDRPWRRYTNFGCSLLT